jgi:protein-tyrosine phosphatase
MADYLANKISDNLLQGGFPPPGPMLAQAGIQVLVLTAKDWQEASQYPGLEVICAPGDDDERPHRLARFLPTWEDAASQVVEHVRAGKNVLVTCMAGHNRSGLVTALALRELTGLSGQELIDHIQKCRPMSLNNETFAKHLLETFPAAR